MSSPDRQAEPAPTRPRRMNASSVMHACCWSIIMGCLDSSARLGRDAGHAVVSDLERDDLPQASELLALADHLILSRPFACAQTKKKHAAEATQSLWDGKRAAVVVTCGRNGCWYCAPETTAA